MEKKRQSLDVCQIMCAAILISRQTGVVYDVQCFGLMCNHLTIEGIYLPLPEHEFTLSDNSLHDDLMGIACYEWYDEHGYLTFEHDNPEYVAFMADEADRIDEVMANHFLPIKVNRARLAEDGEAWFYVHILPNNDLVLAPFAGEEAVLTYANCD